MPCAKIICFTYNRLECLPLTVGSLPLKALWLSENQVNLASWSRFPNEILSTCLLKKSLTSVHLKSCFVLKWPNLLIEILGCLNHQVFKLYFCVNYY